jgi:uncharacterized membrane protein YkvI
MLDFTIYGWCVLGIVISVILPILRQALPRPAVTVESKAVTTNTMLLWFWQAAWPYVALGLFSALSALLIVAGAGDSLKDYRAALLAGYAWDSTLQKLKG